MLVSGELSTKAKAWASTPGLSGAGLLATLPQEAVAARKFLKQQMALI
jgi:hypothetical protein